MSDEANPVGNGDLTPPPVEAANEKLVEAPVTDGTVTDGQAAAPAASADAPVLDTPKDDAALVPDWPDDWREKLAGGDEKALKRLGRFTSPAGIFKSFRELEAKFSRGELTPKAPQLPENPTEEQIAEYRKAVGVPVDGKYDTAIKEGFIWADQDAAVLEDFQKAAHEMNMPQGEFKKALAWYADYEQRQAEALRERDEKVWSDTEDALRNEWGSDYRINQNLISELIRTTWGQKGVEEFLQKREKGGERILASKWFVDGLAHLARELTPVPTLAPSASGDRMQSLVERKSAIEAMMAEGRSGPYWSGPNASALQNEYVELVRAEEKLKSRAA